MTARPPAPRATAPSPAPPRPARTPRYGLWLTVGAVIGFLAVLLIDYLRPDAAPGADNYSAQSTIGYLGMMGAALGAAVAGVIAVLLSPKPGKTHPNDRIPKD